MTSVLFCNKKERKLLMNNTITILNMKYKCLIFAGSLTQAIRNFAKSLENWLKGAMTGVPDKMYKAKVLIIILELFTLLSRVYYLTVSYTISFNQFLNISIFYLTFI